MTRNQFEHHCEQMEAHRNRFDKLWNTVLVHHPAAMKLGPVERMHVKDCCWVAFVQALGKGRRNADD